MQNKLTQARVKLLMKAPFYGNLVMKLKFALAPCGTAATDMKRIIFDPGFLKDLSEEELLFVLQHEVLHCALQHCIRNRDYHKGLYNIAADIVVNSTILKSMGAKDFKVQGEKVMHLTPKGDEGYLYTTEQVYKMLLEECEEDDDMENMVPGKNLSNISSSYGEPIDNHESWEYVPEGTSLEEEWKEYVKTAAGRGGLEQSMPPSIREFLETIEYESRTDWRVILQEFIRVTKSDPDYTFSPPDRRFSDRDFFLPAFSEMEREKIDNLWFLIDTSGSITSKELAEVYREIKECISQFPSLAGKLSFFDTNVYDVIEFDTEYESIDWESIVPVGGGGTSFRCIFEYMREHMAYELPTAVIVLTDGFGWYPVEEDAMGVPVLWVLTSEWNRRDAPWGKTVHLK